MVRAVHDVKATDLGGQTVMFKAEVDIDGREITRSYLEKIDIEKLLDVRLKSLHSLSFICLTKISLFFYRKSIKLPMFKQPSRLCLNMARILWIESVPKSIG